MTTLQPNQKTIHLSIDISAPREKIWDALIGAESFKKWCAAFMPGSRFEGDWSEGSIMKFLGPDPVSGGEGGMITRILEHRPGELCRAQHIGCLFNGKEIYEGEEVDMWKGIEEYTLTGGPERFTLSISNAVPESCHEVFMNGWNVALAEIKRIAEGRPTTIEIDPETDLLLERVVPVSRQALWQAWVTDETRKQWFAPSPWTVSDTELELRPGGKFNTAMKSPEGEEFPSKGCVLQVIPNERLVFTDAYTEGFKPAENPFFTCILTMEDVEGGTLYRALARHKNPADRKSHEDMGFYTGWGQCLDQLVELASQKD